MTLTQKICTLVAGALAVAILGFLIHGIVIVALVFIPDTPANVEENYEFKFEGSIILYDEEYEVCLHGNDGTFSLDANNITDATKGVYTFTEGQGWTFTFDDSAHTVVRSQYDKGTRMHSFVYTLNLGSRGSGNIRLSYVQESFEANDPAWADIPSFSGKASWFGGIVSVDLLISCDDSGNFSVVNSSGEIHIDEVTGTYVYENDCYVFTQDDGTVYTSVLDSNTNLYRVTITIHNPTLDAYGAGYTETVFTQSVLTVD